jgi:glycosyltransferase involved in cell wall biosynthesis
MTTGPPRLSVVIPTYNAARFLDECLGALRDQTYPRDHVEIVIADAGSQDDTLAIAARHDVDQVVENPLRTGEAGKGAGVKAATGDIVVFVDSDNIVVGRDWLERMVVPFEDPDVFATEASRFHYRREDHYINRWHALTGAADPLTIYMGNYCRESLLTGTWTGYPHPSEQRDGWDKVTLEPGHVPVIGANGFAIRRSVFDEHPIGDYLFDLDYVHDVVQRGQRTIGRVDVAIRHYFSDSLSSYRRKTRRRSDDFFYYRSQGQRSYPWTGNRTRAIASFILETVLVVPVLRQVLRGYSRRADPAWGFHLVACWLNLWIYTQSTIRGVLRPAPLTREGWRQ